MAGDYLYAGAWLDDSGKAGGGIRIYEIQIDGTLKLVSHVAEDIAAGYIAVSQDGNNLYAVNEIKRRPDCVHTEGGIYAYEMNQTNGTLKELNHVSSCGVFPNYLVPAPDNRCLYAVNYGSEDMVVRSRKNKEGEWILEEVYEEGWQHKATDLPQIWFLKCILYWTTLQEEINYPQSRGRYEGRRMSFKRYAEAVLATRADSSVTLDDVMCRADDWKKGRELLDFPGAPSFYY